MSRRARLWLATLFVAGVVVAADQITKSLVEANIAIGERIDVLGPIQLTNVGNSGIAFGLAGGGGVAIVILAVATLALIIGVFARDPERPWIWLAVGLLVGGAAGNLIDRIAHQAVTDFIKISAWPSFNVADVAITCGVFLLAWIFLKAPPAAPERSGPAAADQDASATADRS